LFGSLPSQADFALYGQLRQGLNDKISADVMREYPGAWGWTLTMDDLSGIEVASLQSTHILTKAAKRLLAFAAQTYFPFLTANANSMMEKKERVRVPILRGTAVHEQPVFKYQVMCLESLMNKYQKLTAADRQVVDRTIDASFLQTRSVAKL